MPDESDPARHGGTHLPPIGLAASDATAAIGRIGDLIRAEELPEPLAIRDAGDDHVAILVRPQDFSVWHAALSASPPAATRGLTEPALRLKATAWAGGVRLSLESAGSSASLIHAMRSTAAGAPPV